MNGRTHILATLLSATSNLGRSTHHNKYDCGEASLPKSKIREETRRRLGGFAGKGGLGGKPIALLAQLSISS